MADENRNTQHVVEVPAEGDLSVRETQVVGEVQYEVTSATGFVFETQLAVEVPYDTPTAIIITQFCIELPFTLVTSAFTETGMLDLIGLTSTAIATVNCIDALSVVYDACDSLSSESWIE